MNKYIILYHISYHYILNSVLLHLLYMGMRALQRSFLDSLRPVLVKLSGVEWTLRDGDSKL